MKKQLVIATVVCAALGSFYFLSRESKVQVGIVELELPRIEKKRVTRVEFSGKESFAIKRAGDDFVLEITEAGSVRDVPASKEAVEELLQAINGVRGGVFVTQLSSKHKEFGVTDASGTKVSVFENAKPVWALIIGEYADEEGRYVREPSQDSVFLAKARFWDITRTSMTDFRERKIVAWKESDLKAIKIEQGSKPVLALVKNSKNQWDLVGERADQNPNHIADAKKISDYIKMISDLRATAFVEDSEALKSAESFLEKSADKLIVEKHRGDKLVLLVARDAKGKKAFARADKSKAVFEISDYSFDHLLVKAETLKGKPTRT